MGNIAPGWHPDPSGRWQVRWWDGSAWTDQVASNGRRASDPLPAGEDAADLVNRVVAAALGFVELSDEMPSAVDDATITVSLWRQAEARRDILQLAHGHLTALEQKGTQPPRAKALTYLTRALDNPLPR